MSQVSVRKGHTVKEWHDLEELSPANQKSASIDITIQIVKVPDTLWALHEDILCFVQKVPSEEQSPIQFIIDKDENMFLVHFDGADNKWVACKMTRVYDICILKQAIADIPVTNIIATIQKNKTHDLVLVQSGLMKKITTGFAGNLGRRLCEIILYNYIRQDGIDKFLEVNLNTFECKHLLKHASISDYSSFVRFLKDMRGNNILGIKTIISAMALYSYRCNKIIVSNPELASNHKIISLVEVRVASFDIYMTFVYDSRIAKANVHISSNLNDLDFDIISMTDISHNGFPVGFISYWNTTD